MVGHEAITDARLCDEMQRFIRITFHFFSELGYINPQILRLLAVTWSPDLLKQEIMRENFAFILHEQGEESVFGRSQLYKILILLYSPCGKIDAEIAAFY